MDHLCKRCNEKVLDGALCSGCRLTYHYYCVSLSEVGWRRLGSERQGSWICPECRKSPVQTGSISKTLTPEDPSYQVQLNRIENMLSPLTSLPEHVEKLRNELYELTSKINTNVIEDIYTRLADIDIKLSVVESLGQELDRVKSQILTVETKLKNIDTELAKRDTTINNLQKSLAIFELENKRVQQKSRFLNIELVGIPEKSNENLVELLLLLATTIGSDLKREDIEFITRVHSIRHKQGQPRKIVAKIKDKKGKDELLVNFKKHNKLKGITSRDLGFGENSMKIFLNEHLTIANKMLLNKCKLRAKERNIKFVWVKNCIIYLRRNEKFPPKAIMSEEDLNDFLDTPQV